MFCLRTILSDNVHDVTIPLSDSGGPGGLWCSD